jgi:hypothetical protein
MTPDKALARFERARQLGPLALLRLRAEVLLENADVPLTAEERETLDRIAVSPELEDKDFLDGFDRYLDGSARGA